VAHFLLGHRVGIYEGLFVPNTDRVTTHC